MSLKRFFSGDFVNILINFKILSARYFYFVVILIGLVWYAVYNSYLISNLKVNTEVSASTFAELISASLFDKLGDEASKIITERIIGPSDMPIIVTTPGGKPVIWRNVYEHKFFRKILIDPDDYSYENIEKVRKIVNKLKKNYSPKVVYGRDGVTIMGYLFYGPNNVMRKLEWIPFFEGLFIILFTFFVYFSLSNLLYTEKSNLWVGLAKETAHQLGTPISSLMGWTEYIKTLLHQKDMMEKDMLFKELETIGKHMENDISRLQKITNRFSQIGSKPIFKNVDLNEVIRENIKYFETRLPMWGKKIKIKFNPEKLPLVPVNVELFEWVLENLFKNSVDAMDKEEGCIELRSEYIECDGKIRIYHKDNGKGISWERVNNIFLPGYTTKKRGWGLGLALAKRIIEDYHNGKIFVVWSQKGKGTEFCIELHTDKAKFFKES